MFFIGSGAGSGTETVDRTSEGRDEMQLRPRPDINQDHCSKDSVLCGFMADKLQSPPLGL